MDLALWFFKIGVGSLDPVLGTSNPMDLLAKIDEKAEHNRTGVLKCRSGDGAMYSHKRLVRG